MSSINTRDDLLFFDFRVYGLRCREYTALEDTTANRKKMADVLQRIEADIEKGHFDYGQYFPSSKRLARVRELASKQPSMALLNGSAAAPTLIPQPPPAPVLPLFEDFVPIWRAEKGIEWRKSYKELIDLMLTKHILPSLKGKALNQVDRAAAMAFRAGLAQPKTNRAGKERALEPSTVNKIMGIVSSIFEEAAARHDISNPFKGIRRLRLQKKDIHPFTMGQVQLLIGTVREDFRNYLSVRFFTGMRSGEINGLKWRHVDLERRLIMVRETYNNGRTEYTKNNASQRDIAMSRPLYEALVAQKQVTGGTPDGYVFANREGKAVENRNFDKRVWRPLLRHLGLEDRRPYQTRHTCATLWLAAGENPEWIARQLGHANTEMLFRVYSRFVPNLTRNDGSAFDNMVTAALSVSTIKENAHDA